MLWINTKRIIRAGFVQFWRSSFVSVASIFVMIITLAVIAGAIFGSAILNATLVDIKSKVDINVYFSSAAEEPDVLAVQSSLEKLPEVSKVEYLSKEEVLENFKKRHENDSTILQSIDEIGDNPLGAVLNIKAYNPDQYETIANFLKNQNVLSKDGLPIIDKINYYDNQVAIAKLSRMIKAGENLSLALTITLIAVSIVITFNTIRLAIYISREEIAVMRLVGASNKYIRGPFVVIGIMYGAVAALITLLIMYPVTMWLGKLTANFFSGLNIFEYYLSQFGQIFLILVGSGVAIGALSSWLAVRKYLN